MRIAIAIVMILHGIAHLPGFIVPWRLATLHDMPYKTTLLSGRFDAGGAGIRIIGLLWLAAALAFAVTGTAMIAGRPWWPLAGICVSSISLVLSLLSLPEARVGVIINVVIIAGMIVSSIAGWITLCRN